MTAETKPATAIVKHSLVIAGHATSISLEEAFWSALKAQALRDGVSLSALVASIDAAREGANLSSAIRVFLFLRAARSMQELDGTSLQDSATATA